MREEYLDWSQSKVFLVIVIKPKHAGKFWKLYYR